MARDGLRLGLWSLGFSLFSFLDNGDLLEFYDHYRVMDCFLESMQPLLGINGHVLNTYVLVGGNYTTEKWRHPRVSGNDNDIPRMLFRAGIKHKRLDVHC